MIPEIYPRKLPQAILFDWDQTLVDNWRVIHKSINITRKALGLSELSSDEYWSRPHQSTRDAGEDLFGKQFEEGERLFYASVEKVHLLDLKSLEGADAMIQYLKKRGIYLGIVSNKTGYILRKEVEHLGWQSHFHKVIGSRDTEEDKPSPIPVHTALEDSATQASHNVWFVGDSMIDVSCARASGCVPVVVGDGEASKQKNIIHAKNCMGLANLIKSL
ncbi:MAG: phosphatase [uncultured bacterium]|nr:MAG: phosphatase [uncultured bacterium]OFW68626.1 MAG: hypothetical protein A2X70_01415 [Alphaproteobacteria bacterium GWC2_42_16]OFW73065.1 MAG: hypothetical protein A2Z80_00045 [Alphaproteobacteria bacterium GWA2_41_27]OFW81639.1 MAG: hypothetical protein A3E50_00045 [Alphaproteobacteria bacterium RIFCSPHIGHO2_12_FULL_42_100]OFW85281.1 MAG: hypothetical protein A2W06_00170 [Alphaproteobacteria bacterium RBG_16_42_14]OFW90539.1 MAG: hypothetical protein A3C41_02635 [Alphaproteobacteria bac